MASIRVVFSALVFGFLLFNTLSEAKEFLVGGSKEAWKIPSSPSDSLNQWAQRSRFQINDVIVWKYNAKDDSVLQVTRNDYANCNISSPIAQFNDGDTKLKLDKAGPYYFISGAKGHCEQGQKMIVVVMSPRSRKQPMISPAPSPVSEFQDGPAVAPTSGANALSCTLMMTVIYWGWMVFI
ncbi:Early nodulin-like protein [Thalictrum thalictroides]|uniref:Early nodulin-like protein n=1 Tax=Thalictrum thalictroides TaxID=46969 RepID=A0A7J6VBH3_THATH|nr:Early nodulin-like protein [Thalictrum thalictroides]